MILIFFEFWGVYNVYSVRALNPVNFLQGGFTGFTGCIIEMWADSDAVRSGGLQSVNFVHCTHCKLSQLSKN